MKEKIIIILALLFFFACKKELTKPTGNIELGIATATMNSKPWNAKGSIITDKQNNTLAFNMVIVNEEGFARGVFRAEGIPAKIGCYKLYKYDYNLADDKQKPITSIYTTLTDDGDTVGALYDLDESKKNYLELIYSDAGKTEFEGRFQTYFNRIDDIPNQPATIVLTEGKFYLKVIK
jgi:hypothetical protein